MKVDREIFCLQPSLARLYSAAASPSERLRSDGSFAITCNLSVVSVVLLLCQGFVTAHLKDRIVLEPNPLVRKMKQPATYPKARDKSNVERKR